MIPVVSVEQMRRIDELATRRCGIPSVLLMEQAGRSVVDELVRRYGSLEGVPMLVVAGKGNNGGDGYVAARHALRCGADVTLLLVSAIGELKGDAKTNFEILRGLRDKRLEIKTSLRAVTYPRKNYRFIVDALFGTSFHGDVKGNPRKVIDWINAQSDATVVAVDIPSGLDAESGRSGKTAVSADLTVTMAFPKPGLFVDHGPVLSGSVVVADIHIPRFLAEEKQVRVHLVEREDVSRTLPARPKNAHKHSVGKVFVLAGSKGLTGAALMSSLAAMKAGAGAVALGVPSSAFSAVSRRTMEVMPLELPSTSAGSVAATALSLIEERMEWADISLIGPGLSRNAETQKLVGAILERATKTLVVDADALQAFASGLRRTKVVRRGRLVLTPHLGEFSRMISRSAKEIEGAKLKLARAYAKDSGAVLVLKGAPTLVVDPSGEVFVNSTGNPGMATAGSGDVLGGIIAALAGQGNAPLQAAINGVYVHGLAGDLARDERGEMGMLAGDILEHVPMALSSLAARPGFRKTV
ncbi:MAG TPA: NAD(P)H-hydrate dehydratase [Bacteroidota bacterium]|nr:NAD(P)H-hydrate dehydratase [Bacteroidota bacterium]